MIIFHIIGDDQLVFHRMKKNKTNSVALNEKLVEELISFGYSRSEILDSIYSLNKDNEGNNNNNDNNNNNNVLRRVDVIKELEKRKEERLKEKNKLEEENKKQNQNNNSNNNQDEEENMCKICFEETINCVLVPVSKLEISIQSHRDNI